MSRVWYEGGTLHRATVSQWNNSTYANRLATASDWAARRPNIKAEVRRSGTMETLRPYAEDLVECVDEAAAGQGYETTSVAELAAGCMILMGWK